METISLQADERTLTGRAAKALRDEAKVPAVVYGAGREPKSITVDRVQFIKTYRQTGKSGLVNLLVGSETVPVLIQEFQQHPVTDFVTHVDFLAVDLKKEVSAELALNFIGESAAVKALGGTLVSNLEKIQVQALPTALVPHLDVDISVLATFDDVIRVKDLNLPEGVKVDEEMMERSVASVSAPRTQAQMEALDEDVTEDIAAVEGAEEAKEGEEGGEAAPAEAKEEKSE